MSNFKLSQTNGSGNLPRLDLHSPLADLQVYLHGAHVTHYQPTGQKPLLFLSKSSQFAADKPIRGGVPICFPWFGPSRVDSKLPIHGLARLLEWQFSSVSQRGDGTVDLELVLHDNEKMRAAWPHAVEARLNLAVGKSLAMTLSVHNLSDEPVTFENALHTYFAVSDVRQISISGLKGVTYLDKVATPINLVQETDPIKIEGETDRAYLNTASTTVISDPGWKRSIEIKKSGSNSTVVWNPWINKAKAMADFGDDEWPNMICVETCNALENAVTVAPRESHRMTAELSIR